MPKDEKLKDIELYYYLDKTNIEDYDQIVSSYIKYYHFRARKCKNSFYFWSMLKLLMVAVLPVIQSAGLLENLPWVVVAFSSGIFLIESILELWRFREKWILYRSTCNSLLSVQRCFMSSQEDGINEKRLEYIKIVESIIGEEARTWNDIAKNEKKEKNSFFNVD